MNNFFSDNFSISNIITCVLVKEGMGQPIHKNRSCHGLVIQLGGCKRYVFDTGAELTVQSGDVFYLPKFSDYRVYDVEGGDCIAANFDLYDKELTYEPFVQKSPYSYKLKKHFDSLLNSWTLQEPGFANGCLGSLYNIIYSLQKNAADLYTPSSAKQLVAAAAEYIHTNISDCTLTVLSVSQSLNISSEYLRRLFTKVYKMPPKQYIIEERMKKAGELLMSNEFMISRVAWLCGYDNESYFSAEFKRMFDCSPSQYRKRNL